MTAKMAAPSTATPPRQAMPPIAGDESPPVGTGGVASALVGVEFRPVPVWVVGKLLSWEADVAAGEAWALE